MKKSIRSRGRSIVIALIFVLTAFNIPVTTVSAATAGVLTYTVSGTSATITACNTTATNAQVQTGITTITNAGYTITGIGNDAFYGCSALTTITIPGSVTSIGTRAFQNCTNLSTITIPNSVTAVGNAAFYNCTKLANVTLESGISSIGNEMFAFCNSLSAITIPNNVKSLGNDVFYGCTGLQTVTLGNSISSIGTRAFQDCTSLMKIKIPPSINTIGNFAFYGHNQNLKIYGITGSFAQIYANNNSIPFVAITAPTVRIGEATNITTNSAVLHGFIDNDGGGTIDQVCFGVIGRNSSPDAEWLFVPVHGNGEYTYTLQDIPINSIIQVWFWAHNEVDWTCSDETSFNTYPLATPIVTSQPTNQFVTAGQNATFNVAATGNPTPTYQWQLNTGSGWNNISGATSTSYTVTATISTQNGYQYRCVVSNSQGTVYSNVATLTVNFAPSITFQPPNQIVNAGQLTAFSISASANPAPTYQWQLNTGSGWNNIGGATGTSYTVGVTTSTQSGYQYRCVVSNSQGTVYSNVATLTVNFAPAITTQPTNQTVTSGQNASFTVTANGNPAPTYQWQVNSGSGWVNIGGATNATYTLTGTTTNQSGNQYRCVATNLQGTVNSNAATLTVNPVPTYGISLNPSANKTFDSVIFGYGTQTEHSVTVNNTGNQPTGNLTVALSGTNASSFTLSTTSISNIAVSGNSNFTVRPNTGLVVGTYIATVTVSGANVTSQHFTVSFTVNPVPIYGISLNPSMTHTFPAATFGYGTQTAHSVTVNNTGNQLTGNLTVVLSGTNASSFTLSTTSISSIAVSGYSSFTVRPNTGLAVGTYTATVAISGSNVTSQSFTVSFTVNAALVAPSITTQPTNQIVTAGQNVTFTIAATGNPTPTYQWQVSINSGGTWTNISGATSATYTLAGTTSYQNGNQYRCVVTNSQGAVNSNAAKLTLNAPLNAPTITVGTVSGKPGETISVPVSISNNSGLVQFYSTLNYDSTKLTLISITDGTVFTDDAHGNDLTKVPFSLNWDMSTASENNTGNGTIVTLNFVIKSDTEPGDIAITVKPSFVSDYNLNIISFFDVAGKVTVNSTAQTYTITATAGTGGTASGGGTVNANASVTLTATANSGYIFDGWYENETKVAGAGAVYSFTATKNRTLEARFVMPAFYESFIDGEVKIWADAGIVPVGAVFAVIKIMPPPDDAVEKVKDQISPSAIIIAYYEVTLKDLGGNVITQLTGDLTIATKLPVGYESGSGVSVYQEDENGKLIEMTSWVEGDYIFYKTTWLETYNH